VRSVLLDLGGVLETGCWPGVAEVWAPRLGITTEQMLAAVFGGSDETVLVGRMSEDDWWQQHVRRRLSISRTTLGRLRADIAARWSWDEQLLGYVARLGSRMRTAIVSNAWPHTRARLAADGVADLFDEVVLSCEAGVAKPDRRIFELALGRLGAEPGRTLFIDDTPGHVAAAEALGVAGQVHTDSPHDRGRDRGLHRRRANCTPVTGTAWADTRGRTDNRIHTSRDAPAWMTVASVDAPLSDGPFTTGLSCTARRNASSPAARPDAAAGPR